MKEKTVLTRQEFIGGVTLSCMLLALGSSAVVASADDQDAESSDAGAVQQKQMGFWVNTANCVDCGTCAHACRRANNTPEDVACRRRIVQATTSLGKKVNISVSCMHCSDPSCVKVCPAGALYKRTDGIVAVNHDRCIGCRYCYQACPFGVPHYTSQGMDKCDYCLGNGRYPEQGPACAEACPHDALHWGDIQDLLAQAGSQAKQFSAITGPSLIVS